MRNASSERIKHTLARMRERMQEPIQWFPFPALIAFGLVIILRGHLLTGLNPRLGSQVSVIDWPAKEVNKVGIWLSIREENGQLVLITDDRRRFSWSVANEQIETLQPLIKYLVGRVKRQAYSSALSLESDSDQARAILAVDQNLKYNHVRPIIYALAEAKISKYGFETRIIRQ